MRYSFYRGKLPRGHAYPIKRSALDAALEAAGITQLARVHYGFRPSGDELLRVEYWGEAGSFTSQPQRFLDEAGRSSLRVYSVATKERAAAEAALLRDGLPIVCTWLRAAERAGTVWRATGHHLTVRYAAGRLLITES